MNFYNEILDLHFQHALCTLTCLCMALKNSFETLKVLFWLSLKWVLANLGYFMVNAVFGKTEEML